MKKSFLTYPDHADFLQVIMVCRSCFALLLISSRAIAQVIPFNIHYMTNWDHFNLFFSNQNKSQAYDYSMADVPIFVVAPEIVVWQKGHNFPTPRNWAMKFHQIWNHFICSSYKIYPALWRHQRHDYHWMRQPPFYEYQKANAKYRQLKLIITGCFGKHWPTALYIRIKLLIGGILLTRNSATIYINLNLLRLPR